MPNQICHFEIGCRDRTKAADFYSQMFDWNFSDPVGPTNYRMVDRNTNDDGVGIAGGIGGVPEGYDGHVTFYVAVPDVEAALQKAEELGGQRVMGPEKIMDMVTLGQFKDPEGHVVGVVEDMPA